MGSKAKVEVQARDYQALAFSAFKRFLSFGSGKFYYIFPDLRQAALLASVEAERARLGAKAAYNLAQRELYRCAKELGFARPRVKPYVKRELSLTEIDYSLPSDTLYYVFGEERDTDEEVIEGD